MKSALLSSSIDELTKLSMISLLLVPHLKKYFFRIWMGYARQFLLMRSLLATLPFSASQGCKVPEKITTVVSVN